MSKFSYQVNTPVCHLFSYQILPFRVLFFSCLPSFSFTCYLFCIFTITKHLGPLVLFYSFGHAGLQAFFVDSLFPIPQTYRNNPIRPLLLTLTSERSFPLDQTTLSNFFYSRGSLQTTGQSFNLHNLSLIQVLSLPLGFGFHAFTASFIDFTYELIPYELMLSELMIFEKCVHFYSIFMISLVSVLSILATSLTSNFFV